MQEHAEVAALAYDILSPDRANPSARSQPHKTNLFIGCGHMLRVGAVQQVGFYTPNPGDYGAEESDLCVRLLDSRCEIFFLPGVHVWHDKSLLGRKSNAQYSSAVCNDLAFAFRRYPFPLIIAGMPAKLFAHFRFAIKNDLFGAFMTGVKGFCNSLPAVANMRRPVSNWAMLEFRRRSRTQWL
jgi:GT2 family glycosyltransferase